MDPARYRRLKHLLQAALDLSVDDREGYLDRECGDDLDLRAEVEELLSVEGQSLLENGPIGSGVPRFAEEDASGQRLGRIRLDHLIARGGMGDVYAGVDELLGRPVAAKLMRAELRMSAERRAAFLSEARTLSSLRHPNICQLYDFFEDGGRDVLVLERIDGETLRSLLRSGRPSDPLAIAGQIADALVAAHERGIAHRDLKPENVMLSSTGTVKVLDFGLARSEETGRRLANDDPGFEEVLTTRVAGTPGYLAPEQARGEATTTATDLWSFGLVLIELLTGRRPYPGDTTNDELVARARRGEATVPGGLPRAETALLQRLLAPAAPDRPSAREVRSALARIRDRPKRRFRAALAASALLLSLLAGLKYTSDLRHERELALASQARAENARTEAEDLATFMLTELYAGLKTVGKLELLEPVAQRARRYYGELDDLEGREGRGEQALALIRVGEVLDMQGHLEPATDAYRRAVEVLRPLADARPDDELVQYRLALAERNLGEVLRFGGEYAEGDAHTLRGIEMARNLTRGLAPGEGPDGEPTAEERWSLLLRGLYLHADSLVRQGHAERALELLDEAERLAVPAVRKEEGLRRDLGDIQYKRCMAYYDSGRVEKVVPACEASFALDEALHEANPDDYKLLANLMTAYWMLGRAQELDGRLDEALATTLAGEAVARRVREREPENAADGRNGVAVLLVSKGRILRRLGRSEARAVFEEVLGITGPLLADGEDHSALHNHVIALVMLGRIEEARPFARELFESGWRRPEFLDLIAEFDLMPGVELSSGPA